MYISFNLSTNLKNKQLDKSEFYSNSDKQENVLNSKETSCSHNKLVKNLTAKELKQSQSLRIIIKNYQQTI